MSNTVNLFYSFRSPYSYLVAPGALSLERDFDVSVVLCPVLPLALRQPDLFSPDILRGLRSGHTNSTDLDDAISS